MSIESTRVVTKTEKLNGQLGDVTPPPIVLRLLLRGEYVSPSFGVQLYEYDENNDLQVVTPQVSGEIAAVLNASSFTAQMYIAQDEGLGLKWYAVDGLGSGAANFLTGKAYDGRAQFYDPLAS